MNINNFINQILSSQSIPKQSPKFDQTPTQPYEPHQTTAKKCHSHRHTYHRTWIYNFT